MLGNKWCSIWKFKPPTNQEKKMLFPAKLAVVLNWCIAQLFSTEPVSSGKKNWVSSITWAGWKIRAKNSPQTKCMEKKPITINHQGNGIKIIGKAIYTIDGSVDFFIDNNFSVTSSLNEIDANGHIVNRTKVVVDSPSMGKVSVPMSMIEAA